MLPLQWIDGITLTDFTNNGGTNSLPFKIFHSPDNRKQPNFALPVKKYYEALDDDSCYVGFYRKFFGKYLAIQLFFQNRNTLF